MAFETATALQCNSCRVFFWKKMSKVIFLGTTGCIEQYIEACEKQGQPIAGIIDSDWYGNRTEFAGLPVLDTEQVFQTNPDAYKDYVFFICVNWHPFAGRDIDKRKKFIQLVKDYNLPCINLVDPTSSVSRYATFGKNIMIGPMCIIEPHVVIDDFVCLWGMNDIGHHSRIGENTIMQRVAGIHGVVGKNTYVGLGSWLHNHPGITVGDNVIVHPFLQVGRDVEDGELVRLSKDSLRIYRNRNEAQ